ncbi:MAG: hypothetical protein V4660_00405 [Pseudomonadota bacterium]
MTVIKYIVSFSLMFTTSFLYAATTKKPTSNDSQIVYLKKVNHKTTKPAEKKLKKSKADVPVAEVEEAKINSVCKIDFSDFQDVRPNKETVGSNFKRSLQPIGLDVWFKDAEIDLWEKRITMPGTGRMITLQPKVYRLYAYAQSMNLHGVMAIAVDFVVDGKVVETRKYRGFGSTMNGWGAEYEYYQALSYAAHDVMPQVLKDVPEICGKLI